MNDISLFIPCHQNLWPTDTRLPPRRALRWPLSVSKRTPSNPWGTHEERVCGLAVGVTVYWGVTLSHWPEVLHKHTVSLKNTADTWKVLEVTNTSAVHSCSQTVYNPCTFTNKKRKLVTFNYLCILLRIRIILTWFFEVSSLIIFMAQRNRKTWNYLLAGHWGLRVIIADVN